MKAMIITEVAAFRQQVRNQIRAAPVRKETYVSSSSNHHSVCIYVSFHFLQFASRGPGNCAKPPSCYAV
jgi:hypothetical protein